MSVASRTEEIDLLVAGAGPAGMAAALTAASEGLNVLICEKSAYVGGTASTSAGTLWIPGNRQSTEAGYPDNIVDARTYLDRLIGANARQSVREVYLNTGQEAIDYLQKHGGLRFVPCGEHPDYQSALPGAAISGRAVVPAPFDGRALGKNFERVRPPIQEFMIFGGMMVGKADIPHLLGALKRPSHFIQAARLLARYAMDRLSFSRGTRLVMGNSLVAQLYQGLLTQGIPIAFETQVLELLKEGARVVGAIIETREGSLEIRARKGVVLATGGFARNDRLRAMLMPPKQPIYSMSIDTNSGDGVTLGNEAGGAIQQGKHDTGGLWTPVSIVHRKDGTKGLYPHLSLDRAKPGLIAVDGTGARFVNEAVSYHDFVLAMLAEQGSQRMPTYLICDDYFVRRYGLGAILPGLRLGTVRDINEYAKIRLSIADLAHAIGIEPARLQSTIERYNNAVAIGVDDEFNKGGTTFERFNGDASQAPNPCMGPIKTAPFYAVEVWPAEIACSSGLSTDEDGRVLNDAGIAIEGLYACGNDMASPFDGTYPGPGTTLGPAFVFAYRAARHATLARGTGSNDRIAEAPAREANS
jgi:succinate dehydrogenase/fumarate reductase flavoprotein subunit